MRTPIVLAALLLLATPFASASTPVSCADLSVCPILSPPTTVSGPVDCAEVVTTAGGALVCTVGDGKVGGYAFACKYCLPLTLARCHEGTDGYGCSSPYFILE
jgi:hypothetical protein